MKYGGENRPEYLRRRHLDRLADELEVRPRLVAGLAALMIGAVSLSRENARASLPPYFRDRPVIDKIDRVIAERCERLAKAIAEPSEP